MTDLAIAIGLMLLFVLIVQRIWNRIGARLLAALVRHQTNKVAEIEAIRIGRQMIKEGLDEKKRRQVSEQYEVSIRDLYWNRG